MTEPEFDILDELYFVKSFQELQKLFKNSSFNLESELWNLIDKRWVKVMDNIDSEITVTQADFKQNKHNYRFNATKQGLFAHNQI